MENKGTQGTVASGFEVVRVVDDNMARQILSGFVLNEADADIIEDLINRYFGYKATYDIDAQVFKCVRQPEQCGDAFDSKDVLLHSHVCVDKPAAGDNKAYSDSFLGTVVEVDSQRNTATVQDSDKDVFVVPLSKVSMLYEEPCDPKPGSGDIKEIWAAI